MVDTSSFRQHVNANWHQNGRRTGEERRVHSTSITMSTYASLLVRFGSEPKRGAHIYILLEGFKDDGLNRCPVRRPRPQQCRREELERLRCELSTPGQDLRSKTGGDKKVKKRMQFSSPDLDPLSMIVAWQTWEQTRRNFLDTRFTRYKRNHCNEATGWAFKRSE